MIWLRAIFMAAALAGCSPTAGTAGATQAPEASARHPVSGLEVIPLTVTHDGVGHHFKVEVARSAAEQSQGLMFRTTMGPDEGMLFPSDPPQQRSFWMRNTVIPLDIIYIDTAGRIESINAMTTPYSETPIPSRGVVGAVLELNGGRAAALGLAAGDKVSW